MTGEFDTWKAQEAAAYLNRVRRSSLDVRRIQDEIEVQRSLLPSGMDTSRERVRAQQATDALERAAMRVLDLIEQYTAELAAYVELQHEAHESVMRLEDARYRAVLSLYYLGGHSWETVGRMLHYSPEHAKRLRAEALPLFWDVMPRHARTMLPRAD